MKLSKHSRTVCYALLSVFAAAAADAAPETISNPSFESPVLGNGAFAAGAPAGWTINNGASAVVTWNTGSPFPNVYYNVAPPSGNQVLALGSNFSSGEVIQDLGITLQPNTTYTLTYWVGARNDIPISSYNVSLIAGGTVLASDHKGNPSPGQFVQRTIVYHSGTNSGGELMIDLYGTGRNYTNGVAGQVNLDLIQLDATPDGLSLSCPTGTALTGVPYSSALVASGGVGPYSYSVNASLGDLTLNPATGAITGNPSTATVYTFTAQVTDSSTPTQGTATANCSIAIASAATAGFVTTDTQTHGTWKGVYGGDGYSLSGDGTSVPNYAQLNITGTPYTWVSSTQDTTCLQKSAAQATDRICAVWYSATSFVVDVTIAGSAQKVALYAVDWDQAGRVERVDVYDAASQTLLNSQQLSGFTTGAYLVWNVSGHVQFIVTRLSGPNAIVSGVFFGAAGGNVAAPQITQNPQNAQVSVGQTAQFTVGASGSGLTYQWQVLGSGGGSFTNIGGAVSSSYTTPTLAAGDDGSQFRCIVSNSTGSVTSAAATLTVSST